MNRIKKIIETNGWNKFHNPRPSEQVLESWKVNIKTWNKWVENDKDPELEQLPQIAEFLECEVVDLIENGT